MTILIIKTQRKQLLQRDITINLAENKYMVIA